MQPAERKKEGVERVRVIIGSEGGGGRQEAGRKHGVWRENGRKGGGREGGRKGDLHLQLYASVLVFLDLSI